MPSRRNANAAAMAPSEDGTDRTRRPRWARLLRLALLCIFCGPDGQRRGARAAARERGARQMARHEHR
ncbi:hypothetical protein DL764_010916 [Monosporascus ibericus]|uniref:Uncharacterized protein n=1 Tax=Monosporascus ibericus TaxID=155417 RepID=A0A4Q4ST65_9PEZI|nr:hypothetical protein DL764_010916 [Monosporascus ibericus]